jgi:hypothetical protein
MTHCNHFDHPCIRKRDDGLPISWDRLISLDWYLNQLYRIFVNTPQDMN